MFYHLGNTNGKKRKVNVCKSMGKNLRSEKTPVLHGLRHM
jgi:hypothetical protein